LMYSMYMDRSSKWRRDLHDRFPLLRKEYNEKQRLYHRGRYARIKKEGGPEYAQLLAYAREWERKNKELVRDRRLQRYYGITLVEYTRMLKKQGHACAVCKASTPGNRSGSHNWPVDHDHKTKRVRGLLCQSCNRALGLLKEDIRVLRRMIRYLEIASRKQRRK
jgi:Autographiviridae endonuclease VII